MPWLTADDPRTPHLWSGSADLDAALLDLILDAAREECIAFAPSLANPLLPPPRFVLAQAAHARNIARALEQQADQVGSYGDVVTLPNVPLDWHVKQRLRPKTRPVVG